MSAPVVNEPVPDEAPPPVTEQDEVDYKAIFRNLAIGKDELTRILAIPHLLETFDLPTSENFELQEQIASLKSDSELVVYIISDNLIVVDVSGKLPTPLNKERVHDNWFRGFVNFEILDPNIRIQLNTSSGSRNPTEKWTELLEKAGKSLNDLHDVILLLSGLLSEWSTPEPEDPSKKYNHHIEKLENRMHVKYNSDVDRMWGTPMDKTLTIEWAEKIFQKLEPTERLEVAGYGGKTIQKDDVTFMELAMYLPVRVLNFFYKRACLEHCKQTSDGYGEMGTCPKCDGFIHMWVEDYSQCQCPVCDNYFCPYCKHEKHWPMGCVEYVEWKQLVEIHYAFETKTDYDDVILVLTCSCSAEANFEIYNKTEYAKCPKCNVVFYPQNGGKIEVQKNDDGVGELHVDFVTYTNDRDKEEWYKKPYVPARIEQMPLKPTIREELAKFCITAKSLRYDLERYKKLEELCDRKEYMDVNSRANLFPGFARMTYELMERVTGYLYIHRMEDSPHFGNLVELFEETKHFIDYTLAGNIDSIRIDDYETWYKQVSSDIYRFWETNRNRWREESLAKGIEEENWGSDRPLFSNYHSI